MGTSKRRRKLEYLAKVKAYELAAQSDPGQLLGGQDGENKVSRSDMRLARRAVVNRWNISDKTRRLVVDKLSDVVRTGISREIVAAARVLVSADALNLRQQELDKPKPSVENAVNVNVIGGNGGVSVSVGEVAAMVRQEILADDDYLDYQRRTLVGECRVVPADEPRRDSEDGNASTVREHGEPGTVVAGSAPG